MSERYHILKASLVAVLGGLGMTVAGAITETDSLTLIGLMGHWSGRG